MPELPATSADAEAQLAALKQLDALLLGNAYSDATFEAILSQLQGYLSTVRRLRGIPLGEVRSATVVHADLSA